MPQFSFDVNYLLNFFPKHQCPNCGHDLSQHNADTPEIRLAHAQNIARIIAAGLSSGTPKSTTRDALNLYFDTANVPTEDIPQDPVNSSQ